MLQLIDEKLLSLLPSHKVETLTIGGVDISLKETGRIFITDTEIAGYQVRIYESGKVGLYLNYRVRSGPLKGRKRSYHLITPDIEAYLSLPTKGRRAAAKHWREMAGDCYAEVRLGGDPAADRADEKRQVRKTRKKKLKKKSKAVKQRKAKAVADKNTIKKLCADDGDYYSLYLKPDTAGAERTREMLLDSYPTLIDLPITAITNEQIVAIEDEWVRGGNLTSSSIDRYRSALKAFFNWCIRRKMLADNPCKGIKKKAGKFDFNKPYKAFSIDEVNALYGELNRKVMGSYVYPDHFRVMVPLAINTGMRRSELLRMDWANVHSDNIDLPDTKNDSSHNVKLNKTARKLMKDWRSRGSVVRVSGKVFDPVLPEKEKESKSDRLTNHIKYQFKKLVKGAGIKAGFHATRHTFGATLARNGVSIHRISQMMNHSSLEITMRYAREYPDHLDDAKILDDVFGGCNG